MLLDLKNLSARLEEGQSRLIDRLDQIVELLETIASAGQAGETRNLVDASAPERCSA